MVRHRLYGRGDIHNRELTEKDFVEISLNLTQAAKIVEKTNPKLADWLKFVNRKAIALVNKEK